MYEVTPLIGRGPRLDTIIKVENDVRGGFKHEICNVNDNIQNCMSLGFLEFFHHSNTF